MVADPNALGLNEAIDVSQLERSLKGGRELRGSEVRVSKDGTVRFAPQGSYQLRDIYYKN